MPPTDGHLATPTFAVVGRSNKGKSSIVATLTENDRIAVAPTPRTTTACQAFTLNVGGKDLFTIVDTPGFEEAPAVLEWLKAVPCNAHQRRSRVEEFMTAFAGTAAFPYERALLQPVLDGAAVLYVVDASHPYRPNYEAECEILQWTGQPSLALINRVDGSSPDVAANEAEWRAALNQYFRKVRVFDAHRSLFADRMQLLDELRVIDDRMQPALDRARAVLTQEHQRRLDGSAHILAQLLVSALTHQTKVPVKDFARGGGSEDKPLTDAERQVLVERFHDALRGMEGAAWRQVAALFSYNGLQTEEGPGAALRRPVYEEDLFSRQTWQVLGLSTPKLIAVGTAAGALAGGSLDAMVGGASVLLGTGLGAMLGGASSTLLAFSDPEVAGIKLARAFYVVGPNKNQNFPWVLLDRGLSYIQAVLQRTHAQRGALRLDAATGKQGVSARLSAADLRAFAWAFRKARWGMQEERVVNQLAQQIRALLTSSGSTPS